MQQALDSQNDVLVCTDFKFPCKGLVNMSGDCVVNSCTEHYEYLQSAFLIYCFAGTVLSDLVARALFQAPLLARKGARARDAWK